MSVNYIMGLLIGGVIGCLILLLVWAAIQMPDPCTAKKMEHRQELIEAHERCMVEANCVYEDWDIRKYARRIAQQEVCKKEEDNE